MNDRAPAIVVCQETEERREPIRIENLQQNTLRVEIIDNSESPLKGQEIKERPTEKHFDRAHFNHVKSSSRLVKLFLYLGIVR